MTIIGLIGFIYSAEGAFDDTVRKNPLIGIFLVSILLLFFGVATLRTLVDENKSN